MHDQESTHSTNQVSLLRMIDAAANRTLEGLRVVEDAVRFGHDDRHLTERLKQTRHRIAATLATPPFAGRLQSRDTMRDVGTDVRTQQEAARAGLPDIMAANFARAQEGLRTLAECAKAIHPASAESFEQARYELYTAEKAVASLQRNSEKLATVRLYVLIDGRADAAEFERLVNLLIAEQVGVIQLRDKNLDDRELLSRAETLCRLTRATAAAEHRTLAMINDRADIAAATRADGVHVGQDELPVAAVRSIVGPDALIGVSTHNIEQARTAVLEGADYLGAGPTFASNTKSFDKFPGTDFLAEVAAEIQLPTFAIGGIDTTNVTQVTASGIRRIAVSNAVLSAKDPRAAIRQFHAAFA